jgi:hypothetical protein
VLHVALRGGGYEYVLTLAAFCIVIAAQGSGKFGLDAHWLRRVRPVAAGNG